MSAVVESAVVERMRWWDIEAVARLERVLFPGDPWSTEQFWQELAQPNREYLVLRIGDRVVGYGGVMVSGADADIQTIAIDAQEQGRGRGRLLLSRLLDSAAARGASEVLLEVRADNIAAIGLYESEGFVALTTRRRYYPDGGDATLMRLSIPQRHNGGPE